MAPTNPLPQEIIRRKRDRNALDEAEIRAFIEGVTEASISEAQIAAFAMAVFLNGMTDDECVALTGAMTGSGNRLAWDDLDGPVVDKHSTGGVGDKVSLVLAPVVAACGGSVPMISGRGLGHTGGTLDKLESIPGYDATPGIGTFRRAVREAGCAIVGQTADLAPADRAIYAVRDVTATVESIPLITASILSKKLAAGLDALVMDVKTGSGAFAAGIDMARSLARSIVSVANGAGLRTRTLITDMDSVLGTTVGNALEVGEAIAMLRGDPADPRLTDVVLALAAEMLVIAGLESSIDGARDRATQALTGGAACERFAAMVAALGGPSDLCDQPEAHLPAAPVIVDVTPPSSGVVTGMDARSVGLVVVRLGGGRRRANDAIDHRVGLSNFAAPGASVGPGHPICRVHAASEADAEAACSEILAAVRLGETPPASRQAVIETVGGAGS